MWLILIDVGLKINFDPYESRTGGFMEKINDVIVLNLSYFLFVFSDYAPNPLVKYMFGWWYNGLLALMIGLNFGLVGI
jgi:hypothetical protein